MIKSLKNRFNWSYENIMILVILSALGTLSLFIAFDLIFVKHENVLVVGKVQTKYLNDMRYVLDRMPYESATVAVKSGDTVLQCPVDFSKFHQMQPGDIGIVAKSIESFAGHEDSDCLDFNKLSGHKANY